MVLFARKRPVPALPPASSVYVAIGDSITDKYEISPFPGGIYPASLATRFGWTQAGVGDLAKRQITTPGTGYNAAPTVAYVGGTFTRVATATATAYNGAVTGLLYSDYGAYTVAPTSITLTPTSGGSGAVANATVTAGEITRPTVYGTSSWDGARGAIGGTTMQAGGSLGSDFVSTYTARCTAYNPDVVSIFLGTNDYFQATTSGITVAKFKVDYQTVITAIKAARPGVVLILIGMLPLSAPPSGGLPAWMPSVVDGIRQFNQAIMELALDNACVYVPLISIPTDSSFFPSDTIHPSQGPGHTYILEQVTNALMGRR